MSVDFLMYLFMNDFLPDGDELMLNVLRYQLTY